MNIARRLFLKLSPLLVWQGRSLLAAEPASKPLFLGQGTMSGEVTDSTALLQTRLTSAAQLDADGDLPGAAGVVCFEWRTRADFSDARRTPFQAAADKLDFIVRAELPGLKPNTTFHYRADFGGTDAVATTVSPTRKLCHWLLRTSIFPPRHMNKLLTLAATLLSLAALHAAVPTKPNIIFILADDLGIGNLSCYGSDNYKSPHIDKLAATGTRFTQSFTGALCGPSRALIITGRYAFRNGSSNQDACMVMPNSELQLGRMFKSAGYATSFIGKWGQLPGDPDEAGFDDYLRFNGSGVYWNKKAGKAEAYRVNRKELKLGDKEYMPDVMHDRITTFLRANQTKPFFLYYSMVHVHGDLQPTPDSAPGSKGLFGDNIRYMDKLVGKLVAELEALKLRDNTLILFMGDNGTGKGQNPLSTIGGRNLSGMKGSMLECGGLVPTIANWPGKVPAGKVSADLIDSTDWLPTFAELSGSRLPEKTIFDGHSIAPQLRGEPGTKREWIYNQLAAMWYVRETGWKLNEKGELYDMSDAPFLEKLVATSADTEASRAARARLTAVLAKLNPAGGIPDSGDGTGRHANKDKKKTAEPAKPTTAPSATPGAALDPVAERAAKFDRLDEARTGKLTRDYYTANQSDAVAAAGRFEKMDTNKDGFVTREEYISNGKQQK